MKKANKRKKFKYNERTHFPHLNILVESSLNVSIDGNSTKILFFFRSVRRTHICTVYTHTHARIYTHICHDRFFLTSSLSHFSFSVFCGKFFQVKRTRVRTVRKIEKKKKFNFSEFSHLNFNFFYYFDLFGEKVSASFLFE